MLTEEFISVYLTKNYPKHHFYQESIDLRDKIAIHAKGLYPAGLIEMARPNEAEEYKDYRKNVFVPKTKKWFSKVKKTMAKGHLAEDWGIYWPSDPGNYAPDGEKLKDYTTLNYPYFDSLENWAFSIAFPSMLEDANSAIAVMPLPKQTDKDTEYLRPYTFYFPCENVIDFKEDQYAVLLDPEKSVVTVLGERKSEGLIFHFFDKESYIRAEQYGEKDEYIFSVSSTADGKDLSPVMHNMGYLPVIKLGGTIMEFVESNKLWDSFVADCVDDWNEAIRRYSDHQVNMVLHLHPFEWEMADTPCKVCKGTGEESYVYNNEIGKVKCTSCGGNGHVSIKTPFGKKVIQPAITRGVNEAVNIPTPPAGIIERDIASISFLQEEYKDQIRSGLAAINLEWLMDVPLSVSGESKAMDRQEAVTFFHEVYRHFVLNVMTPLYYFVAKWRYSTVGEDQINKMMPYINIPKKFDLVTADLVGVRLKNAIESKFNPLIVDRLNIEYAKKEFGEGSDNLKRIECIQQLDPLPNKTDDEKMTAYSSKAITLKAYILSENLPAFVERAIFENKDFLNKNYAQKMEILEKYVEEVESSTPAPTPLF